MLVKEFEKLSSIFFSLWKGEKSQQYKIGEECGLFSFCFFNKVPLKEVVLMGLFVTLNKYSYFKVLVGFVCSHPLLKSQLSEN